MCSHMGSASGVTNSIEVELRRFLQAHSQMLFHRRLSDSLSLRSQPAKPIRTPSAPDRPGTPRHSSALVSLLLLACVGDHLVVAAERAVPATQQLVQSVTCAATSLPRNIERPVNNQSQMVKQQKNSRGGRVNLIRGWTSDLSFNAWSVGRFLLL